MEAVAARTIALRRSEVALAALLATAAATLLVAFGPPAGDAAAHLYRTLLAEKGVAVWDNLWYGGQYPFASYSLLYYLPAALLGNVPIVFAAVVLSAALFASLSEREWGSAARWPARVFGVLATGPLFTGTYSYALGLAALLGCLRALQAGRPWLAILAAALTLGFSPLAFLFLCVVLLAVLLARRRASLRSLLVGAGLVLLAGLQLATGLLFPLEGSFPFRLLELVAVLGVAALGASLALRTPRGAAIASFFLVWAVVNVASFFVSSPLGENVSRLRSVVFPLVLLAAVLAGFRPRWLAALALSAALAHNLVPYVGAVPQIADAGTAREAFWAPAVTFLRARSTPDYRVDVVPTSDNWEAYWLPRAGIPLARGWYRQIDISRNPVLYEKALSAAEYRAWLRRMGVRYVVLPDARLDHQAAEHQAELLRSGRSGLVRAFRTSGGTIYELPRPTPLLTGPGRAGITALTHDRIAGWTAAPGAYRLRVRFTPYWTVSAGDLCVAAAPDGMTRIDVLSSGRFALAAPEGPAALVRSVLGESRSACEHR